MIPPIEERMVRPCFSWGKNCINYDGYNNTCLADPDKYLERLDNSSEDECPCLYNLYSDELKELITATRGNLMIPLELCQTLFSFMLEKTSPAMVLLAAKDTLAPEDLEADDNFWTEDQEIFAEDEIDV